jgi:outer membrane immunogenic protein
MKRIVAAAAACAAIAVATALPAAAADLGRVSRTTTITETPALVPLYNWTGFYVGATAGGAWAHSDYNFGAAGTSTGSFGIGGGVAGVTLGYNYQVGSVVFGLEGDINASSMRGGTVCPGGFSRCDAEIPWFGTLRGRVGFAADRFMPYVTGGLAMGRVNAIVPEVGSASSTRTGWTLGAGVETAVARNWTAKAEYLYVDLGRFDCGAACSPSPTTVKYDAHVVRLGVNYRF